MYSFQLSSAQLNEQCPLNVQILNTSFAHATAAAAAVAVTQELTVCGLSRFRFFKQYIYFQMARFRQRLASSQEITFMENSPLGSPIWSTAVFIHILPQRKFTIFLTSSFRHLDLWSFTIYCHSVTGIQSVGFRGRITSMESIFIDVKLF